MKRVRVVVVFSLFAACVSTSGHDAGPSDAGSCGCAVEGNVLSYSWECFCASGGCASAAPATTCSGTRDSQVACGLRTDSIFTPGGPFIQVFDATGALVGQRSGSDTDEFVCPDDPSLRGFVQQVGTFPDAGCAVTTCDCVDGGVACPAPPSCGCQSDGGVMTMSWECFCREYGCDQRPITTCSTLQQAELVCGQRVDDVYPPKRITVFDDAGVAIGGEVHTDLSDLVCPDDASIHGSVARAGSVPAPECAKVVCDCIDGGVVCPPPAPSCGCSVEGDTLTYSWDCFCATHDCTAFEPQALCGLYPPTVACGLRTDQFQNIGGTNLRVFENGVLVGAQLRDDTPSFACPDDSSMVGSTLRAGTFADAGCAVTTCDCVDGGVACP